MPRTSLYHYIWQTTKKRQLLILFFTGLLVPLAMVPLELQRRIVDDAVTSGKLRDLFTLGAAYLAVVLLQGGLKYLLNLTKGKTLEDVARNMRRRILKRFAPDPTKGEPTFATRLDEGAAVSILAAETEEVAGFASESIATPLLQGGTIVVVLGYLIWVEPLIAVLALLVYLPQILIVPHIQRRINRLVRGKTRLMRRIGHEVAGHEISESREQKLKHRRRSEALIDHIYKTRLLIYSNKYFLTFLGNLLDALGPIVVLVLGGYLVIVGKAEVSTLVVFISGFQRIADPWDQLVNFYRTASHIRVSYSLIAQAVRGDADVGALAAKLRTGREEIKDRAPLSISS